MPDVPTFPRTRLGAVAGVAGAAAVVALVLGAGPAPSVLQLAGASDDVADDISGNCDEAEHAADPECTGTPIADGSTSTTIDGSTTSTTFDDTTSTTAGDERPTTDVRSIDAAGAGTVIVALEGGSLRLVTATPAPGWRVEVEQSAGREVELDFRSGTRRVQVNLEIEDGAVRERVRVRDDADDTDIRTEDGVVVHDGADDNSGPGNDDDHADDDHSGSGHGDDDDDDDDDDHSGSGHGGDDD